MKEKYLLAVRNAMFWHFSSSEIRETIGEINMYFESALQEGESEEEVMERYSEPKMFVREMRDQPDLIERKRRRSVFLKFVLLAAAVLGMVVSFIIYPSIAAGCLFVVFSSIFVWFLSGNSCMIEVITMTERKKRIFWKSQMAVLVCFLLLQLCSVVIVPCAASNNIISPLVSLAPVLRILIYVSLLLLGTTTVIYIRKMLHGNVYMFFCIIQNAALIYGVVLYYDYLKHIENVEEIGFIFTPYLLCIPVLLVYWGLITKSKRDGGGSSYGCTD